MSDTRFVHSPPTRPHSTFPCSRRDKPALPDRLTTPTSEFSSRVWWGHLTLTAGAAVWLEAMRARPPPARGNAARSRRTRGRRWPAFCAHDAARTALEHPFRAPFPSVTQRSYRRLSCGGRCTGHTEKIFAHDTYETTESIFITPITSRSHRAHGSCWRWRGYNRALHIRV